MNYNMDSLLLLGMSQDQIKKMSSFPNIPRPDYSSVDFLTKTPPSMSEEEYEEAIRAQAKKDALSSNHISDATKALRKDFVSVASPDRKNIISSALQAMSYSPAKNSKVTFAEFKNSSSQVVAKFSSAGGWYAMGTPEEFARGRQFDSIYREAYVQAYNEQRGSIDKSI